ncbi:hypothetical protein FA95DRAFT_1612717 [Auriscalpium vulgare]|uniref:Uncharacterized protein n=1 Tax=Auriscalpium vulgare TaxID=40419 RepID=A0ACB8R5A5_9AGAM|nr:hypothetical protein FA95DRAFT_1612717 [Auriscalpium vulgare]
MADSAGSDEILSHYRDVQQVTAAVSSAPPEGGNRGASDALCVAELPGSKGELWISSPNADFVPEVPTHSRDEEFSYYTDGMLGPFEHLKWPQVFDMIEPHAGFAPANPLLLQCTGSKLAGPDPLPSLDFLRLRPRERISTGVVVPKELAVWKDDGAPWFSFNSNDWRTDPFGPDLGRIDISIITRLRDAAADAYKRTVLHEKLGEHYVERQFEALTMAITGLDRTLPLGQAIQWHREAQRLLLDLRAWYNYMVVFKPRIEGAPASKPAPIVPVRGVITGSLSTVQLMYRVGIPVWWVRPVHSLDRNTWIRAVVKPTPWTDVFASKKTKKLGNITVKAPAWKDGVAVDNAHAGFADRLRRFCLSSKPIIVPPRPIIPDAPDDPPTMTATLEDLQAPSHAGPSRAAAYEYDDNEQFHAEPTHAPDAAAPPAKKVRWSKGKGKATASTGVDARDAPGRPNWLPATNHFWAPIEAKLADMLAIQNKKPIQYSLPPFHAFAGNVGQKMHNWLRIRPHCFIAVHSEEEQPTTLTASAWKVALEGRYHTFSLRPASKHRPQFSAELIAQLPPHPHPTTTLGKRREPDAQSSRTTGAHDRRIVERVNVAVHFGVIYSFPPYHPDDLPHWRSQPISAERAANDKSLWKEVAWQLSVKHFRLELLQLDAEIMAEIGEPTGYYRHLSWLRVWNNNGSLNVPTDPAQLDFLLSDDWLWRRAGVLRWRTLISVWPEFEDADTHSMEITISEQAFKAYEVTLYESYARYFYKRRGRLPTFPLTRPSSIAESAE